jgi:translation initiation factor 1
MTTRSGTRPVYTTAAGRLCPTCGWPVADCRCSARFDEALPSKIVAKVRLEKAGRGGKTVTVVDGLPRNAKFLAELAAEAKRACGTGGAAKETTIELQGNHRDRLRALLRAKGWEVKG